MPLNLLVLCTIIHISHTQVLDILEELRNFANPRPPLRDKYDFIIVGGGSSGAVVASRLSEIPEWSVLLLEAGREESFVSDVPLSSALLTVTDYNWGFRTEKTDKACLGLVQGRCHIVRGKALGGSSVVNFLVYNRGNKEDFNEWEQLGNPGWGYSEILPYFKKSENCSISNAHIDWNYHGRDGYLNVQASDFQTPIVEQFLKAGEQLGYARRDINGEKQLGFAPVQATMRNGARCSAAKAFLNPTVRSRPNLHIWTRSRVTRILINPTTKNAYGVEFLRNGNVRRVEATKEVIMAAGSLNTPQLLMLSGVGPADHLSEFNIPVIKNLKVGYNFQDHVATNLLTFLINESVTISDIEVQNPRYLFEYLNGKGPLTLPGGAEALAFIKTKYARNQTDDYPDIEFVLGAGGINNDVFGSLRYLGGIPEQLYRKTFGSIVGKPSFALVVVLMRPKNRGRLLLKDANPLHRILIQPNYFDDPEDIKVLIEGIRIAINLTKTEGFKKLDAHLHTTPILGCEELAFGSDDYWTCVIRRTGSTLGHQVGTCKMGPSSDSDAVVDPQLRVYGISNLRVVDGSMMPNVVAGHTNAVIMMIGEKASDLIKDTWVASNEAT